MVAAGVPEDALRRVCKWEILLEVDFGEMEVEEWRQSVVETAVHVGHAGSVLERLRAAAAVVKVRVG